MVLHYTSHIEKSQQARPRVRKGVGTPAHTSLMRDDQSTVEITAIDEGVQPPVITSNWDKLSPEQQTAAGRYLAKSMFKLAFAILCNALGRDLAVEQLGGFLAAQSAADFSRHRACRLCPPPTRLAPMRAARTCRQRHERRGWRSANSSACLGMPVLRLRRRR
jgi:hypothetical protein